MFLYVTSLRGVLWMWLFGYVEPKNSQSIGIDQFCSGENGKSTTATPAAASMIHTPRRLV